MKNIIIGLILCMGLSMCNSTLPVTANPAHDAYTNGSTPKVTDGPLHEQKSGYDSTKILKDSLIKKQ